jgi:hypothetical protein
MLANKCDSLPTNWEADKRAAAEKWAGQALVQYLEAAGFIQAKLAPWLKATRGRPVISVDGGLEKMIQEEKEDRKKMAETFK